MFVNTKMLYLLLLIIVQQVKFFECQVLPNIPCPNIFEYVRDGYPNWNAVITVPTPDTYKVIMSVNFTVGEIGFNDNGKLSLNDMDNAIENIKHYKPFKYTVFFPRTRNIPQVTEISYNGVVICVGPGLQPPSTSFWLSHTLNWFSSEITFPRGPNSIQPITRFPEPPEPPTTAVTIPIPIPPPITIPPTITNVIPTNPPIQKSKNKGTKYTNNLVCGTLSRKRTKRNTEIDVVPFIYNGTIIPRNDHPWLAALYSTDNGLFTFFCGANLISEKHVISAAHCTLNKNRIQVKIGARTAKELFDEGSILRVATKIVNHHEYKSGSAHADISLIILNEEVPFTATIKPICLWDTEDDINTLMGRQGTIMGWGLTENGDQSTTPLKTDITIASQQQCRSVEALKNSISDMTFCAGTKGTGPCMGDSGGGLFMIRHRRWFLRGIISRSIANRRLNVCDVNTYAVYVDTAKYLDWIVENTK